MGRLPFDPTKMAISAGGNAARTSDAAATNTALTVSQLARRIDGALRSGLPTDVLVIGEVSGFRDRTHWYFDLKDADAVVNCVMFASAARRAGFVPANGQQFVARGNVEFYAKGGKVTLIVSRLEALGAGPLEMRFRKLCEELRGLGWFAPERKRRLPTFPRRIAVVTSATGAAYQDVLVTLRRRCPVVGVLLVDVRVQGERAAGEIAAAVRYLSDHHAALGVDAVLVTRGGGSMEDLWAFNEKLVAEAIVGCAIPVVAAIGHETDTTIAELVADERCATPTQAAMRLSPDRAALLRELDARASRLRLLLARRVRADSQQLLAARRQLRMSARERVAGSRARLERATALLRTVQPGAQYAALRVRALSAQHRLNGVFADAISPERIQAATERLRRAMFTRLKLEVERAQNSHRQLQAVGPLGVLRRGYSVTTRMDGSIVRGPSDVRVDERIVTKLADGQLESVVSGVDRGPSGTSNDQSTPRSVHRPRRARSGQKHESGENDPGLFAN